MRRHGRALWVVALCAALWWSALQPAAAAANDTVTRLPRNVIMGAASIQAAAGDRVAAVAAASGLTVAQFNFAAQTDRDFGFNNRSGRAFFRCGCLVNNQPNTTKPAIQAAAAATLVRATTNVANASEPDPTDTTQAFKLHSRPGASKVIVLDFTGHVTTGTDWNVDYGSPITTPPYDTDGNPSSFSEAELREIIDVWRSVSADYASYDVDVTTEDTDAGGAPVPITGRGSRVAIGGSSYTWLKDGAGGIAYVGAFGMDYYMPAFVFVDQLGDAKSVAEATSHEVGHNLGLLHDGKGTSAYYAGHAVGSSGTFGWAPIMGVGYYQDLTTWSKGEYAGATQTQDDLQVISGYIPFRADDHGNTPATATALTGKALAGNALRATASAVGNIERPGDQDWLSFTAGAAGAATVTLSLVPDDAGGAMRTNLDAKVELWAAGGAGAIAAADPAGGILRGAAITASLPAAGGYLLMVTGVGDGADATTGYTSYGSLGEYVISVEYPNQACDAGYVLVNDACEDIDECTAGTAQCDALATCANTPGNYTCTCPAGYTSTNGRDCVDVDECATQNGGCNVNALCTNTPGSLTCACKAGYTGDGKACTDIDECTAGTAQCDALATCSNTPGNYTCACPAGYTSTNGRDCVDLDECATGQNDCGAHSVCTNTVGSFSCACMDGFAGANGKNCSDIDECATNNGGCDVNALCTNTIGNYTCACKAGFKGDGKTCTEVDLCDPGSNFCDGNATCSKVGTDFTCECNAGFTGDGKTCADVDECTAGTDDCDANAVCSNTPGSFTCACKAGFQGDGKTCVDLDECATNNGGCATHADCINTIGGHTCKCASGYSGDGYTSCTDINECSTGAAKCSPLANCTNTAGSYQCTCKKGYSGDGVTCADVDECALGTAACSTDANCTNTDGGYTCKCKWGFRGDGFTCTDIDECRTGRWPCHQYYGTCTNLPGNYTCTCKAGFAGDGVTTCNDINECNTNNGGCDKNADCVNKPGTFTCKCRAGFVGDGFTCTDFNECARSSDNRCNRNADCINTPGSYSCACKSGYTGNGLYCNDVDECRINPNVCGTSGRCRNLVGSYSCDCKQGYTKVGSECVDINECSVIPSKCPTNSVCTNTPGSYSCGCLPGYGGSQCRACPTRTYSPGGSLRECSSCPPRQKANATKTGCECTTGADPATSCQTCLPGYGGSYCSPCTSPSTYSPGGSLSACATCPIRKTANAAHTACVCVAGANPATSCSTCLPGFGGSSCSPCTGQTYSPGGSLAACAYCAYPKRVSSDRSSCLSAALPRSRTGGLRRSL